MEDPVIVVAGAGAIGCFVGGLLSAAGRNVRLFARGHIVDEVRSHGLTLSDFTGLEAHARPEVSVDPEIMQGADVVLVCVKGSDTTKMGALVAANAPLGAVIVSLQNGLGNAEILHDLMPKRDIRAGMVGFNVVSQGGGRFHRSVSGEVAVQAGQGALGKLLNVPGLEVQETPEIAALQRGKLIMNLSNAVNTLSGLSLRDTLLKHRWRRVMAAQITEAQNVFKAAGLEVKVPAPVPGWLIPWLLRLPTFLFRPIAARMLTVDAKARTSMVIDLEQGRSTEIDLFQGAISTLGMEYGVDTLVNDRVKALIREAEIKGLREVRVREILG